MLGSAASYGVFFYNASRGNLTALSSLTFLTPMFAAGTGFLLLGETLTPLQVQLSCSLHSSTHPLAISLVMCWDVSPLHR
jgi:drug/metabolite transporter (DMT)-like permease